MEGTTPPIVGRPRPLSRHRHAQTTPRLRGALGTGSVLGMLIAIAAGLLVWRNWTTPTALEGRYWVFGLIVLAEAVLIGVGCIFLARRGLTRDRKSVV